MGLLICSEPLRASPQNRTERVRTGLERRNDAVVLKLVNNSSPKNQKQPRWNERLSARELTRLLEKEKKAQGDKANLVDAPYHGNVWLNYQAPKSKVIVF